jgi:uncharacterized membrane protein YobD (UPF0266 family)
VYPGEQFNNKQCGFGFTIVYLIAGLPNSMNPALEGILIVQMRTTQICLATLREK